MQGNIQKRLHFIDWLRVLAMITVFTFHCLRYFDNDGWHVKNPVTYKGISIVVAFLVQWIMPLFFVLSAFSSFYSLSARTGTQFITERLKRLGIPLLFGTLVILAPVQVYIERLTSGLFNGSFWDFYPEYFNGFYAFGGNFAWMGLHLWYLEILLFFSIITLPLLLFLKNRKESKIINTVASLSLKPFFIYLLIIPTILVEIKISQYPNSIGNRGFGGWSLGTYCAIFITGYILSLNAKFIQSLEKFRLLHLILGITTCAIAYILHNLAYYYNGTTSCIIRTIMSYSWIFFFIGFGHKHLHTSNAFLRYSNKAVLPFYIIHQTVIVILGYLILYRQAVFIIKFFILFSLSLVIIVLLYEYIIKRVRFLHILFGIK